jgi:hypothetical protein
MRYPNGRERELRVEGGEEKGHLKVRDTYCVVSNAHPE